MSDSRTPSPVIKPYVTDGDAVRVLGALVGSLYPLAGELALKRALRGLLENDAYWLQCADVHERFHR